MLAKLPDDRYQTPECGGRRIGAICRLSFARRSGDTRIAAMCHPASPYVATPSTAIRDARGRFSLRRCGTGGGGLSGGDGQRRVDHHQRKRRRGGSCQARWPRGWRDRHQDGQEHHAAFRRLRPGVAGSSAGLKLDIEKATLTRGKTVLARIERVAKPSPSAQARRSQAAGDFTAAQSTEPPERAIRTGGMARGRIAEGSRALATDQSADNRQRGTRTSLWRWPIDCAPGRCWPIPGGKLPHRRDLDRPPDPGGRHDNQRATECVFCADGNRVLACCIDPSSWKYVFRLWNLETGQETVLDQIENPGLWPFNLCLSDDAKRSA